MLKPNQTPFNTDGSPKSEADLAFTASARLRDEERQLQHNADKLLECFDVTEDRISCRSYDATTILDLCYTVFMKAKAANDEDGGPTDWFTDTKPLAEAGIKKMLTRANVILED